MPDPNREQDSRALAEIANHIGYGDELDPYDYANASLLYAVACALTSDQTQRLFLAYRSLQCALLALEARDDFIVSAGDIAKATMYQTLEQTRIPRDTFTIPGS